MANPSAAPWGLGAHAPADSRYVLSLVILYGMLAACASAGVVMVLRYDLHDREPWPLLAVACALGAGLMWLAGGVQGWLIWGAVDHAPRLLGAWYFSLLAGVTEEAAKLLAVLLIVLAFRRHFNDPLDGIVYGSMAGLGAAIEESIWVMGFPTNMPYLPATEPIRLAGHLVMGGIAGWGLGMAACGRRARTVLTCWLLAVAMHVAWDYVAFESAATASARGGHPLPWQTLGAMGIMGAGLLLYKGLLDRAAALSRASLAGNSRTLTP